MIYKCDWIELKVYKKKDGSEGKYAHASLTDERGGKIERVSIFPNFPNFFNLRAGNSIEGDLIVSEYNGRTQYKLEPAKTNTLYSSPKKTDQIKIEEKRSQNIQTAQENKEIGIKTSSTARQATDVVTNLFTRFQNIETVEDCRKSIKEEWEHWRKYFWDNWDYENNNPPF